MSSKSLLKICSEFKNVLLVHDNARSCTARIKHGFQSVCIYVYNLQNLSQKVSKSCLTRGNKSMQIMVNTELHKM